VRYLLLFLLPLLLFSKPFKVATYNVENLFDAEYVGTEYDDYRKKHNWTKRMVDIKLDHVAQVICDVDADILALQEIENKNIFAQLQKKLSRVGCNYPYAVISSKKGASIQVALLSRFPIKNTKELQVSYSPRVRNILEVKVEVKGRALWLFVNHWKSRAYRGYESKRMKYAKVLKKRLERFPKTNPYIVLGDFNTDYDAHVSLEKKIDDTEGKTGLHNVLGIAKNKTLLSPEELSKHTELTHSTLWLDLAYQERWNTKFYGKKGTPDHIILPSSLFDKKGINYVNHSFHVFRKPYLFTKKGYIHRWQYKKGKHRGKGYSDHLPIMASFDFNPYIADANAGAQKVKVQVQEIDYLYAQESLESEVILKDVLVIWKEKKHALIKQSKEGRGIFLFSCAKGLEVGRRYNIRVQAIKSYQGLKEITHLRVLAKKEKVAIGPYLLEESDLKREGFLRQNEVLKESEGIYKNGYFYTQGLKIPLYFKKKIAKPKNGSKLKIHKALLGYYKQLQLVLYSPKDFTVLEK